MINPAPKTHTTQRKKTSHRATAINFAKKDNPSYSNNNQSVLVPKPPSRGKSSDNYRNRAPIRSQRVDPSNIQMSNTTCDFHQTSSNNLPAKTAVNTDIPLPSNEQVNDERVEELVEIGDASVIVIHVHDDMRGITKDFQCDKNTLLHEMSYFDKFVKEATALDEVDISVHCDIKIFSWLMKYLRKKKVKKEVYARYLFLHPDTRDVNNLPETCKEEMLKEIQSLMTPTEIQIYEEPQLSNLLISKIYS